LDGSESRDPDGQKVRFNWIFYREVGSYQGAWPAMEGADEGMASFIAPEVEERRTVHVILIVRDEGEPQLTRYARLLVEVWPRN